MQQQQPSFRVIAPGSTVYKPPVGETLRTERDLSWPYRRDRWVEHYERGAGYRQAVACAWTITVRGEFTKAAIQAGAQDVGWATARLLLAFEDRGLPLPRKLETWAARHVERYRRNAVRRAARQERARERR